MKRPKPPAPPAFTSDEASAAAIAVHQAARQREAWARIVTRVTPSGDPDNAHELAQAAILRSALLKLLVAAHPSRGAGDVAEEIVKLWDDMSDKDEARERERLERAARR
jgi:hypothetical protein